MALQGSLCINSNHIRAAIRKPKSLGLQWDQQSVSPPRRHGGDGTFL
ncbi:hypothetical protein [Sinorhizobium glycinis]|nr:hypothetical protein [Sinorhizobium glycinis]